MWRWFMMLGVVAAGCAILCAMLEFAVLAALALLVIAAAARWALTRARRPAAP